MLKKTLIALALPLLLLAGNYVVQSATGPHTGRISGGEPNQKTSDAPTGTLQKMIVENGSVTLNLDLNRLNGISSSSQNLQQARFAVAANSFFPVLVFNDSFRGMEPGSMALIPAGVNAPGYNNLPAALNGSLKQLAVERLPSGQGFDLAVRDSNTGFTFFNLQGLQYRLRRRCAVACHHEWQTASLKRVCQRTWSPIGRWFIGRNNRYRRDHATDPDHSDCQRTPYIGDHATHAKWGRHKHADAGVRTRMSSLGTSKT